MLWPPAAAYRLGGRTPCFVLRVEGEKSSILGLVFLWRVQSNLWHTAELHLFDTLESGETIP